MFPTQIVGATAGHLVEPQDSPCCEGENNVLAHVPSVKLETRSPKGDDTMTIGGSDDECIKPAISEEALSRWVFLTNHTHIHYSAHGVMRKTFLSQLMLLLASIIYMQQSRQCYHFISFELNISTFSLHVSLWLNIYNLGTALVMSSWPERTV